MIRRHHECPAEVREQMRGGKGRVRIEHYWRKGELNPKTRLCAKLVLEPGASIGEHEHGQEEEVYVVLKGRGRIVEGATVTEVGPGDTILTGNGASHAVECVGAETLEMLALIVTF